jgi:hypothetical protein
MASWQYAFLFPASGRELQPAEGLGRITRLGFTFDETARLCEQIDAEGHLLDVGEEMHLEAPIEADLSRLLLSGTPLSAQARNDQLALSCQFFTPGRNPHICLGWSARLFADLGDDNATSFWAGLCAFAHDCAAGCVIVIEDAPDFFEDRFIEIEGIRFLEMEVEHTYGLGVREVWINLSLVSAPPEGPKYTSSFDLCEGFRAYLVAPI